MAGFDWCRLWNDMPTDPKWRAIARRSGQRIGDVIAVFNFMMVCASTAEERGSLSGWDDEDVAAALDIETEAVVAIREGMQGKVLEGDRLAGWERRQPKSEDTSTDRVRQFRERKRQEEEAKAAPCNGTKRDETPCNGTKRDETPCNAPDTDTEGDTDKEKEEDITASAQSAPSGSAPGEVLPFEGRYAFEASTIRLKERDLEAWRKAYPHLALEAELWGLDEWAGKQGKKWFPAISGALAKKNREAAERLERIRIEAEVAVSQGQSPPRTYGGVTPLGVGG